MKIGFWGYPNPEIVKELEKKNPEWIDLDIDFGYPESNILPDAYCKIIKNIIDNAMYLKPDIIVATIGKDKCDSGWFASCVLKDLGFNVIHQFYCVLRFFTLRENFRFQFFIIKILRIHLNTLKEDARHLYQQVICL